MKKGLARLAAVCSIGLASVSGCAFGDRHVMLSYDKQAIPAPITNPNTDLRVNIGDFTNVSEEGNIIGCVRNMYGWKTAKVIADNDVGEWVRKAITEELERAGCSISEGSQLRLEGDVHKLYTDLYMFYESEIAFSVRAYKNGKIVYRDAFSDSSSEKLAKWATSSEYGEVSNKILEKALRTAVPRIVDKLEELCED